jgi:hypothetical protein
MTSIIESVSLRGMLGKWLSKRSQRRRQRSLEDCLRQMDPHTLKDIGFEAFLEEANAPESRAKSAVIVALKQMTSRTS